MQEEGCLQVAQTCKSTLDKVMAIANEPHMLKFCGFDAMFNDVKLYLICATALRIDHIESFRLRRGGAAAQGAAQAEPSDEKQKKYAEMRSSFE